MKDNNWEKEYCDKFGLCLDEECNCKKEIKFISKLLKEQRERIIEEVEILLNKTKLPTNGEGDIQTFLYIPDEPFNRFINKRIDWVINKLKQ
jgi:hypothetical protein